MPNLDKLLDPDVLVVGIFTGIIANFIFFYYQKIRQIIKEDKSPLSGIWESTPIDRKIFKKDQITLYQHKTTMKGEIQRLEPIAQDYRKWNFEGKLINSNFCAVFWPTSSAMTSYGCWYLHQTSDLEFKGFYLKLSDENAMPIQKVPIVVKKIGSIPKHRWISALKF